MTYSSGIRCLRHLLLFLLLSSVISCTRRTKSEVIWEQNFPGIGSQSSPRVADLNGDGVRDIVIGAGQNEYQRSKQGILALDGKTGRVLWQVASEDQVYGSATLYDVTGDGVPEVFIGGRSPHFKAINGSTGEILWEYQYRYERHPVLRYASFNFNNSVRVPDQNKDGFDDLLTVNGGNSLAAPYSKENRFPGVLMLFSSANGEILAADTMPDGAESYMSPLCFRQKNASDHTIVFGTGGETLSGHLYIANLSDFLAGTLSRATAIATEHGHGFIAPPTLADITGDGYLDIVAVSHGSTVFAIDGRDHHLLWKRTIEKTECSNSLAAGFFTGDRTPDFFTFVSKGQWPNSTGSLQVMLDGKDGSISYLDSMGCTGFSSPVVYDLDHDGRDEAIISINEFDCSMGFAGESPATIRNRLIAIDFGRHNVRTIDEQMGFKNIFTTPWIGDLDDDGYLDVVHCQYFHHGYLLTFLGMRARRIATPIRMKEAVRWGGYMGTQGDGIFETQR